MKHKALIACVIALMLIALFSPASAHDSCYPHGVAYVERLAVIRDEAGYPSRVVALAYEAGALDVLNSMAVSGECWALVEKGWLLTEDLSANPVPTPPPPTLTPVKPLIIEGDAEFVAQISMGLSFLREQAPRWYRYVTQYQYSIQPAEPNAITSYARWPDKRVYIHDNRLDPMMMLALVLVHEACHIHQGMEGRWYRDGFTQVRNEQECVRVELLSALEIAPEFDFINKLIELIAEPHWRWREVTRLDPSGTS